MHFVDDWKQREWLDVVFQRSVVYLQKQDVSTGKTFSLPLSKDCIHGTRKNVFFTFSKSKLSISLFYQLFAIVQVC